MTHAVTVLILQLAVLLLAAFTVGQLFEHVFRLPRVLGELAAGMIVGPFGFGRIHFAALHQALFPLETGNTLPVSVELYGVAVLASIILLFLSGLETDLPTFLKFSGVGSAVGIGGVIVAFVLGDLSAVLFLPTVDRFFDPQALFLGTLSTATSVGITARILSERRKMSSPEGVTILAAAVLDDVLGIVLLAVVVALARVHDGSVDWLQIGRVAAKAFGFWIGSTVVGIIVAPYLVRGLKRLGSIEIIAGLSLGLALLLAGLAETVGLAMIIGAYVMGLSLSQTDIADQERERLHGLYAYLVPIFFAVMGLMVDFQALVPVVVFGLIFSAAAIAGKLIGCGIPALLFGFNVKGAFRIGAGMLPRGEVTLIVAGIGLSSGAIGPDLFGVAVMTLLVSSVIAPPLLIGSFRGSAGHRTAEADAAVADSRQVTLQLPSVYAADFVRGRIIEAFRAEEFFVSRIDMNSRIYRIRQDEVNITMVQQDGTITLSTPAEHEQLVRLLLLEELVELKELIGSLQKMGGDTRSLGDDLVGGMFGE
ncbi:MAG: cation:proton antiporter [Spirochaeta sp.]|nr:cation:proton antiporter [Spirochaeta sp.]